jgi:hypothetical protein
MIREMHYTDRSFRAMDLAEKMAERRRQSIVAASKTSRVGRMARMLFAPPVVNGNAQAEGRA